MTMPTPEFIADKKGFNRGFLEGTMKERARTKTKPMSIQQKVEEFKKKFENGDCYLAKCTPTGEANPSTNYTSCGNEVIACFEASLREHGESEYKRGIRKANSLIPAQLPRDYDGNNLCEAGKMYGIAAESWSEIIRYQDGYEACRGQFVENFKNLNTK